MTHPYENWNPKAHSFLTRLINEGQKQAERDGLADRLAPHEVLTLEFIDTHRTQLAFTPRFLRNEERNSAGVFVHILRRRLGHDDRTHPPVGTSRQLAEFATVYFPNFVTILQIEFLRMLRSATTPEQIEHNGLLRLAAAYCDGVRDDAEREVRRMGGSLNTAIIDEFEIRTPNNTRRIGTRTNAKSISKQLTSNNPTAPP